MNMMEPLGKLENVELRDIWQGEAANFTPWLAREGNKGARIGVSSDGSDFSHKPDRGRQHQWYARQLQQVHRVFAKRIKGLKAKDWRDAPPLDEMD